MRISDWSSDVCSSDLPAYVAARGIGIDVDGIGPLTIDVAYGGNFYAIIEPQRGYRGLDDLGASGILALSPRVREAVRAAIEPNHPPDPTIRRVSHVLWAEAPKGDGADGRKAWKSTRQHSSHYCRCRKQSHA